VYIPILCRELTDEKVNKRKRIIYTDLYTYTTYLVVKISTQYG